MKAAQGKVARRYANAFISALQPAQFENARMSLNAFAEAWEKDTMLRDSMINPATPIDQRVAAIRDIALAVTKSQETASFLGLLVNNRRISALPEIAVAFSRFVDELRKQLTLEITSAFPLDNSEREAISTKVQKEFGSLASITWNVDKSLIGGILVRNGDRLLDGSIKGSLERVRNLLQA